VTVAIVGSRSLGDECYDILKRYVPEGCSEVVSGGAAGVDALAERYAEEHGLKLTVIRPDYKLAKRAAPLLRNGEIIRRADYVLILWDGVSRGTLHVIKTCLTIGKRHKLLLLSNEGNNGG